MKLDAIVFMTVTHALVIDYKTGKKLGNEIKHGEQVLLYAIGSFMRYPKLRTITVELWYPDADDLIHKTYTREEAMKYLRAFEARFSQMTTATFFPANANIFSCSRCPYGPKKGQQCSIGMRIFGQGVPRRG